MTQYLKPSFTVLLGSKEYAENWDAVFGKKGSKEEDRARRELALATACDSTEYQSRPPTPVQLGVQLEKPESLPRVCRTCSEGHGDWPHVHTEVTEDGTVRISRRGGEDDSDE